MMSDDWGGSELHTFAKTGKWKELLEGIKQNPSALLSKNESRQTPMHYALRYGAPTKIILDLVELEPSVLHCKNDEGDLPLHVGCEVGFSVRTMLAFLEREPRTLHFMNHQNKTALEIAKSANGFVVGCSWEFYSDDHPRIIAALESPQVREAMWEAQRRSDHRPAASNTQAVWNQDANAEQAARVQADPKNRKEPQVFVGIPVDPYIRANLAEIQQYLD